MAEPRYAELLTPPHNYAVVQLPDRRYPGVVTQGDSLATICARLGSALAGDLDELVDAKAELDDALRAYVAVLQDRSIEPPFLFRPPS
jgi:predicted RNase H-like HicB family nuclease